MRNFSKEIRHLPVIIIIKEVFLTYIWLHLLAFLGTKLWGLDSTVQLFRRWGHFGTNFRRSSRTITPEVIWAKCQASYRWLPFPIRCLDQAIVIWYALNRSGFSATLKIGMSTTPLESHAWVESDGKVYVDIVNRQDFHEMACYPPWA